LPLLPGWPTDSAKLTDKELESIRQLSVEHKLPIVALMENLNVLAEAEKQKDNLARLRRAGEIAQAIDPQRPLLIETILGGKPAEWEEVKERMLAGLRKWVAALEATKTTLAIKAHVGNAAHLPEHIVWLLKEVDSPHLRAAYDFSHFQVQGRKMFETIEAIAKHMAFVHVKDVRGTPEKFEFLLPGEGTIDYTSYFRKLAAAGYTGPVVVEVSGQIFGRANYDPHAAAKQSFAALDKARRQAFEQ
jgi:inosose dehydratase